MLSPTIRSGGSVVRRSPRSATIHSHMCVYSMSKYPAVRAYWALFTIIRYLVVARRGGCVARARAKRCPRAPPARACLRRVRRTVIEMLTSRRSPGDARAWLSVTGRLSGCAHASIGKRQAAASDIYIYVCVGCVGAHGSCLN